MVQYFDREEDRLPYWEAYDPDMDDLEELINQGRYDSRGRLRRYFNFIVVGTPKTVSPQWIAKHPGYNQSNYEYAVSYSIWGRDVGDMLDDTDNPVDAFNYYLEGSGKEWIEIERIDLVDRDEPWNDTL